MTSFDGPTARGWQIRWFAPSLSQHEYERVAGPFFMVGCYFGMAIGGAVGSVATWLVMR